MRVQGSGLRVDTVGTNYSFRFSAEGVLNAISFPPFDVRPSGLSVSGLGV